MNPILAALGVLLCLGLSVALALAGEPSSFWFWSMLGVV